MGLMRILIAEDDRPTNELVGSLLREWGHEVVAAYDGAQAWDAVRQPGAPRLAILDRRMPHVDGLELCRRIRADASLKGAYLVLVTSLDGKEDIVAGLEAGANDYLPKPFHIAELKARLAVGERVVALQEELAARVRELETAAAEVKSLRGILPICGYCKRIRDDKNYWNQVERYVAERSQATFSHGICPDCYEKKALPDLQAFREDLKRFDVES